MQLRSTGFTSITPVLLLMERNEAARSRMEPSAIRLILIELSARV